MHLSLLPTVRAIDLTLLAPDGTQGKLSDGLRSLPAISNKASTSRDLRGGSKSAAPTITDVASGATAGVAVGIPVALIPVVLGVVEYVKSGHGFVSSVYDVLPSSFANYWAWLIEITFSCAVGGGVAGLFVAIGPRRSGQRQSQAARWHDRDAVVGRILFGLLYGATYSLIITVATDLTVGWPNHPTLIGAIAIAAVVAVGLAAGLAAGNESFRMGTVAMIVIGAMLGAPFLLYKFYPPSGYAVGLPAGLAAGLAVMARGSDRHHPSRSIRWRPRNGIISGAEGGIAVAVLTGFATDEIPVAIIFGLVVGLGVMVIIGLERVPGDLEVSASPIAVLKRDRFAAVTLSLVTAIAAGLAIGVGTSLESANNLLGYSISPIIDGVVFGLLIGPVVGLVFGLALNGYGSPWPQWIFAREILVIRRRIPQKFMASIRRPRTRSASASRPRIPVPPHRTAASTRWQDRRDHIASSAGGSPSRGPSCPCKYFSAPAVFAPSNTTEGLLLADMPNGNRTLH